MSTTRPPWRSTLELPLIATMTTWVALFSWRGFTQDSGSFLLHVLLAGILVALTGSTLRWRRLPVLAVIGGQAVVALVVCTTMITGSPVAFRELVHRLSSAIDNASAYASPVPHTDTVDGHPLFILSGVALVLLVDVIACTIGQVPLAGLPLLAIYSVPLSLLTGGLSWWIFALTAFLFLLMLFVQEQQQVGRWGRSLGVRGVEGQPGWRPHNDAVRVSATTIGGMAIAAAVILPTVVPTLSLTVFDFGPGNGNGGDININNPMVDLTHELRQGDDVPLLRVTTDDPDPSYLRISVLNRFSGDQWSSGDRTVPSSNRPDGAMPALQGVDSSVRRTTYAYQVTVDSNFHSTWLPTQAPISSIDAPGDWRYDLSTMDFIAGGDNLQTAGLNYDMTAVDLHFTAAQLSADSRTPPTGVSPELTSLPQDLPAIVTDDANQVTANARSPFEKAVALQTWFRTNFTYDIKKAPEGDGSSELADFLAPGSRTGYCQQFSAAMATMARVLHIPARIAVGFLQPTQVEGTTNTYEYSAHDLHAWPELYFSGAGWVRFDPTPADRVRQTPSYTRAPVSVSDPSPSPSTNPNVANPDPRDRSNTSATPEPRPAPVTPTTRTPRSGAGSGFPWQPVLGTVGGLAVVLLVLLAPRLLRSRRRTRRLAGDAEDAWAELRASVLDLGLAWPEGRSPRAVHDHLVGLFRWPLRSGGMSDAVVGLDRIVLEVERSRYARSHTALAPGALADDVRACAEALAAGVTPGARIRATWVPRSLAPSRARTARLPDPAPAPGSVVERI